MSNKQSGAAPEENLKPPSAPGRFSRVRALPGFRAAATAFVLTVILGAGVPAAYAYWSQSTALTVTGTTPRPVTPVPGATCSKTTSAVAIQWKPDSTADREIRYIVTLEAKGAGISAAYALPAGTPAIWSVDPLALYMLNPKSLTVQTAGSAPITVTATVRSAILEPGLPATTVAVTEGNLRYASAPATVKMNLAVTSSTSGTLACA